MTDKALYEKLRDYCNGESLPMHMPGHKRNISAFDYLSALSAALDITEIDSFDDLNAPEDIFAESERIAAGLWGSDETIFSVNGSTGAILASVRALTGCVHGRTVIVARNCHKSVYHALELCACRAVYIAPTLSEAGFALSVTPESVREALERTPDAAAVILTSPTYEGVISDVASIADACHSCGVPLMVDEAHGAHLSLHGVFREGAVKCGADIVIQSIHKTLPSLTQTALVHRSGGLVSSDELRRQMALFQSSSPSYLLSASIDGCVRFLASTEGEKCLREWKDALDETYEKFADIDNLRLFTVEDGIFAKDETKLVLLGDGFDIMRAFRNAKVELEMASVSYAVAMTGAGDTTESLDRFCEAASGAEAADGTAFGGKLHLPRSDMRAAEAVIRDSREVSLSVAEGNVSASYVYAYPPGIPILVPGEVIDSDVIETVDRLLCAGAAVRGLRNGYVKVIK